MCRAETFRTLDGTRKRRRMAAPEESKASVAYVQVVADAVSQSHNLVTIYIEHVNNATTMITKCVINYW